MVKDVVKSEYRMIDMWSCFQAVKRSKFASPAEKKCTESREETHQLLYVVNLIPQDDKHVVRNNQAAKSRELLRSSSEGVVL